MPTIEKYTLPNSGREYEVVRSNTRIDGYIPIQAEALGIWNLLAGANNYLSWCFASVTNERLGIQGTCQLKDACINIFYSPITWFTLGVLACSRYYKSMIVPPIHSSIVVRF